MQCNKYKQRIVVVWGQSLTHGQLGGQSKQCIRDLNAWYVKWPCGKTLGNHPRHELAVILCWASLHKVCYTSKCANIVGREVYQLRMPL